MPAGQHTHKGPERVGDKQETTETAVVSVRLRNGGLAGWLASLLPSGVGGWKTGIERVGGEGERPGAERGPNNWTQLGSRRSRGSVWTLPGGGRERAVWLS